MVTLALQNVRDIYAALCGTDLDMQLRRRGSTGVVLGRVAASLGVESNGRSAYDHRHNVSFAADCMGAPDPLAHEHNVRVTFPHFGEVATAGSVIAALAAIDMSAIGETSCR